MGKHIVQQYFDTYPDAKEQCFDTKEKALNYIKRKEKGSNRHLVTWEYRGERKSKIN